MKAKFFLILSLIFLFSSAKAQDISHPNCDIVGYATSITIGPNGKEYGDPIQFDWVTDDIVRPYFEAKGFNPKNFYPFENVPEGGLFTNFVVSYAKEGNLVIATVIVQIRQKDSSAPDKFRIVNTTNLRLAGIGSGSTVRNARNGASALVLPKLPTCKSASTK